MGFFKKRGKPRQYMIEYDRGNYTLCVWLRAPRRHWDVLAGTDVHSELHSLRLFAVLDAKVRGYGDNYEITELI